MSILNEIQSSVSVNKIVLQHSHAHSFSYYPWLVLHYSEKLSCDCGSQCRKYLQSGSFPKEFADPWFKWSRVCLFKVLLDNLPNEIPTVKIAHGELVDPWESTACLLRTRLKKAWLFLEFFKASVLQAKPSSCPRWLIVYQLHSPPWQKSSPHLLISRRMTRERLQGSSLCPQVSVRSLEMGGNWDLQEKITTEFKIGPLKGEAISTPFSPSYSESIRPFVFLVWGLLCSALNSSYLGNYFIYLAILGILLKIFC